MYVLAEQHRWLRDIATHTLRDPVGFWQKMESLPLVKGTISKNAQAALDHLMPEPGLAYSLRRRVSGVGCLGHPRFVALAEWHGGKIAREAKALVPSACVWTRDGHGIHTIMYQSLLDQAVRCRDPFVQLQGRWLVRRLAPYCSRIELTALPRKRDEGQLLYAMGWETANVHLGSHKAIKAIQRDHATRKATWLREAAKRMTRVTMSTDAGDVDRVRVEERLPAQNAGAVGGVVAIAVVLGLCVDPGGSEQREDHRVERRLEGVLA